MFNKSDTVTKTVKACVEHKDSCMMSMIAYWYLWWYLFIKCLATQETGLYCIIKFIEQPNKLNTIPI